MELVVEPRIVKSWDDFLLDAPQYSIALDGYVRGPPVYDVNQKKFNFNHHEGVDRLATRSTTGQVYMAIKQGLMDCFRKDSAGKSRMVDGQIYVNDADQDTCVAIWLLQNYQRIEASSEPLINKLVHIEDLLDTTAGAFPNFDPDLSYIQELGWVFEPYVEARMNRTLVSADSSQMRNVIESVLSRISDYSLGKAKRIPLNSEYVKIGGNSIYSIIEEKGFYARSKLSSEGVRAFVSVKFNPDGTFSYSLGRSSAFIDFPLDRIYVALNYAEGLTSNLDCWGGSDTVGGSPRFSQSKLSPIQLEKIINSVLGIN